MKRLLTIATAIVILLAWTSVDTQAHTPPGNDGGYCHGANKESCRPDPQPSHGQDCQPHGNNQDGNDDHCASTPPSPSSTPTTEPTPSASPSVKPSTTPSTEPSPSSSESTPTATPSNVDVGGGNLTPPPTDTENAATQTGPDPRNIVAVVLFVLLVGLAFVTTSRRLRQP